VPWIHKGEEKRDHDGLDLLLFEEVYDLADRILIERRMHLSFAVCPLDNALPQIPRDQGRGVVHFKVEGRFLWPGHPPNLEHIFKAFGCDQAHPGPFPLDNRIGSNGGAVDHVVDLFDRSA